MAMTSSERAREWRIRNPDRAKALHERQYAANTEKIKAKAKQWAEANPERRKQIKAAYDDRRRNDAETWSRHITRSIKCRCSKNDLPFDLTWEDILSLIPADLTCKVLGIPLIFGGKLSRNSPSIDRHIPSLGYVKGNVSIISMRANAIKSDATDPNELRSVADYMARNIAARGLATLAAGGPPVGRSQIDAARRK
ncbi:hypothetical protein ABH944_004815 [Caballeronia udeis]|uniref:Uncharacterized protein n=1 Tax=Caballeronia udeis TaxID=1232866 RepID=A0ABW8MLX7_9BURK